MGISRLLWIAIPYLFCLSFGARAWNPHDISILLPLPQQGEELELLNPRAGETLLPLGVFETLPRIVRDIEPSRLYNQSLRVVALRLDPCFKENSLTCRRQIRLVWQPLVFENHEWTTLDAAIHTFYDLSEVEWLELLKGLSPLRVHSRKSLGVHPALKNEGFKGKTWRTLKDQVLRFCTPRSLSRATAMTVSPLGTVWLFSGLNIEGGRQSFIRIPRVDDDSQGFFADPGHFGGPDFRAALNPFPPNEVPLLNLLRDSLSSRSQTATEDLILATRSALRLENPKLTSTVDTDCVSCHVSHAVTSWSVRNFANWDWKAQFRTELYRKNGRALLPKDQNLGPNVLRAFGYFGSQPIVSRRVTYETNEAITQMPKLNSTTRGK